VTAARSARLDARHEAAIEAACNLDRRHFEEHGGSQYLRRPVPHEACPPGERCRELAGYLVSVAQLGPGLRTRAIVPAGARA